MLNSKTVLVLGAGASFELNMPLGSKLVEDISTRLAHLGRESGNGRNEIAQLNICLGKLGNWTDVRKTAWQISGGVIGTASIDDYVETHHEKEHVAAIAKTLIAQIIAEKEKTSHLFSSKNSLKFLNQNQVGASWMMAFWRLLQRGALSGRVDQIFSSLHVVNFNY